jgi:hypothetical protein
MATNVLQTRSAMERGHESKVLVMANYFNAFSNPFDDAVALQWRSMASHA